MSAEATWADVASGDFPCDVLGTNGSVRKEMDGWVIADPVGVRIEIGDSPGGPVTPTLRWDGSALVVDFHDHEPVELTLRLAYRTVLSWLWGDWCLGHLLTSGQSFQAADVFALSVVDGLVKAPTIGDLPDPEMLGRLLAMADQPMTKETP